jgi:hypothetical protein
MSVVRTVIACIVVSSLAIGLAVGQGTFVPRDESAEDYPAGPGREQTFNFCTECHGFKLVAQQGMTRRQWDEALVWMGVRHRMPKLEGNDRKVVLDYLGASFPPRTRGQSGWKSPFIKE